MQAFSMLKKTLTLAALLAAGAAAQAAGDIALTPDEMKFNEGRVVLDENAEFNAKTLRVTIPAGKTLEPHGPKEGYLFVTVISGTLELGFGKTFDESKLKTLPPGSVFTHPLSQQHFARTGKEPVVLQLTVIKPKGSADKAEH